MIDIHTHILPNIDDGARNIDETISLIKEAKNAGFDSIVLTPHYKEGFYETDIPEREMWQKAVTDNLHNKNINIDLYLGNEIELSENIIHLLEEGKASTINNTSYVLFEMPLNYEPEQLYRLIYEMEQCKIVPILAHPERYTFVQEEPELIYDLIERGVLMQANYGSIIGQYGEKAQFIVRKFLENNMIHLLGSDAHRPNTIYKRMSEIIPELKSILGEEKFRELSTENPNLVLHNKRINIREPNVVELTFKEKFLITEGGPIKRFLVKLLRKRSSKKK